VLFIYGFNAVSQHQLQEQDEYTTETNPPHA